MGFCVLKVYDAFLYIQDGCKRDVAYETNGLKNVVGSVVFTVYWLVCKRGVML